MVEILNLFTSPNDIILDPFSGSGTTALACLLTGRRSLSIELNPTWASLSRARLQAAESGSDYRSAQAGQLPLLRPVT